MARLNLRDDLEDKDVEKVKDIYKGEASPPMVALINLSGDMNIGMMIRTASNFGIDKVHILGRKRYDRRTAVGMQNYIPVERHSAARGDHSEHLDEEEAAKILVSIQETHLLVFIEQASSSLPLGRLREVLDANPKPPCFILGNEGTGIPPSLIAVFPDAVIIEIPQKGVGRSFNVASAGAIVLWEYFRLEFD